MGCGLRDDEGKGNVSMASWRLTLFDNLSKWPPWPPVRKKKHHFTTVEGFVIHVKVVGNFKLLGNFIGIPHNSYVLICYDFVKISPRFCGFLLKPGWDPTLFEDERRAAVEDALQRWLVEAREYRVLANCRCSLGLCCHVFGKVCWRFFFYKKRPPKSIQSRNTVALFF